MLPDPSTEKLLRWLQHAGSSEHLTFSRVHETPASSSPQFDCILRMIARNGTILQPRTHGNLWKRHHFNGRAELAPDPSEPRRMSREQSDLEVEQPSPGLQKPLIPADFMAHDLLVDGETPHTVRVDSYRHVIF